MYLILNVHVYDNITKKNIDIIDDSMLKHINGYELLKSKKHEFNVKSRFHTGAKICCMTHGIKLEVNDIINLTACIKVNIINSSQYYQLFLMMIS